MQRHIKRESLGRFEGREEAPGGVAQQHPPQPQDITDRQWRQDQKLEAVGQLTGGIAHHLNNILTVITGSIEMLAEGIVDRPELAAIAKTTEEAAARGADLVRSLLACAGQQSLRPRQVDVNELVTEAAQRLRATLGEPFKVRIKLAGDTSQAEVDPVQLTQAIRNLALNARDAMPDGGEIVIETGNAALDESHAEVNRGAAGDYVMVAVSDDGHGIPAAMVERVFEPFFTTREIGKSTGIGLSVVYGFVKQSNGHISLCSEGGQGTTIRLYLPKATGAAGAAEVETAAASEPGREVVLIVEDDDLVRHFSP
jgi:signal transduction histidine kinase